MTPDAGYHIARVVVDGDKVASNASYTSRCLGSTTIDVTFERDAFTITPTAGAGGAITPNVTRWINYGSDSATYTITPDPGYYVSNVVVDGVSKGAIRSYKFVDVRANHTISAVFLAKTIIRVGGDRYQNALTLAKAMYPGWKGVKHVVIASGEPNMNSYFEAATAPGLAGAYNAPVLLLPKSALRSDVRAALIAMPNGLNVHIVGGTAGVSTAVRSAIKRVPGVASVDRVTGTDRYGTAAAVNKRMKSVLGSKMPKTVLITAAYLRNGTSRMLWTHPRCRGGSTTRWST